MPKPIDLDIVLIRVGPTAWDEAGRLCGSADLPLCSAGEAHAQAIADGLAQDLRDSRCSVVLSGADEASVRTAEIVAARVGCKARKVEELDGVSLGLWEGMLETEAAERYPKPFKQWTEDPASVTAPQGESIAVASGRLGEAIARSIERLRGDRSRPIVLALRPIAFACAALWLEGSEEPLSWPKIKAMAPVARIRMTQDELRARRETLRAAVG